MIDPKKMFDLGVAFLNAGEVNFREGAIKYRSCCQNVAGIVNLAFSCELFIKCLLNLAGHEARGHNLEDLWSQYKKICEKISSEIEDTVMRNLTTNYSFDNMLHNDGNIYCNYRYLYEPNRLVEIQANPPRLQFLKMFAIAMSDYLRGKLVDC